METGFLGPQLVSSWKSARWLGTAHRRWGLQGGREGLFTDCAGPSEGGAPRLARVRELWTELEPQSRAG